MRADDGCGRDRTGTVDRQVDSGPGTGGLRVTIAGKDLFVDPEDQIITPCLLEHGVWEPSVTELVSDEIRSGDTVLDIGANVGYYTLLFAELVGEHGRVFAFEPDPMCQQIANSHLARHVRIV